jgi:hypothetical protein
LMLFGTPAVNPTLSRFSLFCAVVALGTWTAVAWVLLRGRPAAGREPS